jgi:hypothetical protein
MADWATIAGIGIAGAALFVSVLALSSSQQDKRPKLKVSFAIIPGYQVPGRPGREGEFFARLYVVNTGQRLVRVEEAGVYLPDERFIQFQDDTYGDVLPCELAPGQRCTRYMVIVSLAGGLLAAGFGAGTRLRPYARDAASQPYYAKSVTFTADNFLAAERAAHLS